MRGSLDGREDKHRAAQRPADQPETKGKRPSAYALAERDNTTEQLTARRSPAGPFFFF